MHRRKPDLTPSSSPGGRGALEPDLTGERLRRSFFDRPCVEVARDLVGIRLVHAPDARCRLVARIVEVEAYVGDGTDPGAHGHGGITPRTRVMFGPPGHIYVYRSYGMHTCLNVVTESDGRCAAVLIRAVEPLEGIERMRRRRGNVPGTALTNGPGKLTEALGIGLGLYGADVEGGPLYFLPRVGAAPRIGVSRRIGLSKGKEHPYRFFDADSSWVGPPRKPLAVLRSPEVS